MATPILSATEKKARQKLSQKKYREKNRALLRKKSKERYHRDWADRRAQEKYKYVGISLTIQGPPRKPPEKGIVTKRGNWVPPDKVFEYRTLLRKVGAQEAALLMGLKKYIPPKPPKLIKLKCGAT